MSTELAVIIAASVPTTIGVLTTFITGFSSRRLKRIEKDIIVCKDASYAALEAHVKNGSNGNVKRSFLRIRKLVFDIPEEEEIKD